MTPKQREQFQDYWRCEHYASSLDNFFARRTACEHGCKERELAWYHSGTRPSPIKKVSRVSLIENPGP